MLELKTIVGLTVAPAGFVTALMGGTEFIHGDVISIDGSQGTDYFLAGLQVISGAGAMRYGIRMLDDKDW